MEKFRRVGGVFLGLGVLLLVVLTVAASQGSFGGGYTPPSEEDKVGLVEIPQAASSGKLSVPSALRNPGSDAHPAPLIDTQEIRSGGPPPDGIAPIDNPLFQPAADVDWLRDIEPVVVLTVSGTDGDETRAYPVQILTWHELVNDTVAGVPVTVSFCPLCNSAVAYERAIDGDTVLDFGTSGSLYKSSLVMYDRQTESLWTHFDGRAVVGHLAGEELTLIPMLTLSWGDFRTAHPDSLVLSKVTGFSRDYGANPYPGYDDAADRPFRYEGPIDDRLGAKERVAVARIGGASVTVEWDALATVGVHETVLAGQPIVFLHGAGTASALDEADVADGRDIGSAAVYEADERTAGIRPAGDGTFETPDGTRWTLTGEAVSGPAAGRQLIAVEHLDTFWFAIAAFDPGTRIEVP